MTTLICPCQLCLEHNRLFNWVIKKGTFSLLQFWTENKIPQATGHRLLRLWLSKGVLKHHRKGKFVYYQLKQKKVADKLC